MTNQYFLLLPHLLVALSGQAQSILITSDQGPVPNASLVVTGLKSDIHEFHVSDEQGKVQINQQPPYEIIISHVNFETRKDTIQKNGTDQVILTQKYHTLDEIVVTGQYLPQSVRQSVYNVQVLDHARLTAQGASSLTEVLASELNFRFQRDNATGSSSASLQGISGQNIKVLLDGVPIVGRSGVSNEIDLNQINLNSIDKIEIVEGPMAVNYGADALAGVINIITKVATSSKWSMSASLQEETVGREYDLLDEGIHNASVSTSYNFNSNWSALLETRYQKFGGWSGIGRDKLWYPKNQFFQSGLLKYDKDKLNVHYRLDYLNETIENLGAPEQTNEKEDPHAYDKEYLTHRWMHQIQAEYALSQGSLNTTFSYSDYHRTTHRFKSYLLAGVPDITTSTGQDTVSFQTLFFRTTLNDAIRWGLGSRDWHAQFGLDGNFANANGTTLNNGKKQVTDIGFFASTEIQMGQRLKLRPGARLSYNNTFRTRPSASINLKYDLNHQSQIRLSYGRGFRAPSLRELYHEFVDSNHNILGNPNLKPEYSDNVTGDFTRQSKNRTWNFTIKGFYNVIHNRISYFTPDGVNQATTYSNVLKYKTLGTSGHITFERDRLKIKTGLSYTGRYHRLSQDTNGLDIPQFLYSSEFVTNIQYDLFGTGIKLASFYKYSGPMKQYINASQDDGTTRPELRQLDGYHLWDLTLTRHFAKRATISLGAKNLLNVTSVTNTVNSGGAHTSTGNGQSSIAYGRSYLIRLNYKFFK